MIGNNTKFPSLTGGWKEEMETTKNRKWEFLEQPPQDFVICEKERDSFLFGEYGGSHYPVYAYLNKNTGEMRFFQKKRVLSEVLDYLEQEEK